MAFTFDYNSLKDAHHPYKTNVENGIYKFQFQNEIDKGDDFTVLEDSLYLNSPNLELTGKQREAFDSFKEYIQAAFPIKNQNVQIIYIGYEESHEHYESQIRANYQRWLAPLADEFNKENGVIEVTIVNTKNRYIFKNVSEELKRKARKEMESYSLWL